MRRPLVVLAAAVLLQFTLTATGYADTTTTVDQTVEASTQRAVGLGPDQEVGKLTNPRVRVSFTLTDPNLIGVSVEEYAAGLNPDYPTCQADHDPLGAGTANMTVVADLEAGATGTKDILVEYTETHVNGDVHTHEAYSNSEPLPAVGPAGAVVRQPVCIAK